MLDKPRDPFIDNARLILVFLVVFGHLISPFKDNNEIIYFINNFVASFRMPALIMISGFFSKRFNKEGYIEKITVKLFVPYLIFQFLYSSDFTLSINWFNPSMGLWFLLSIYCWNLMLFIFTRLKHPILVSIITGIGIGLINDAGHYLSISRTFVFFPFFLLGVYTTKSQLDLFKRGRVKVISIVSIAISLFVLNFIPTSVARGMLLGRSSFDSLELTNFEGIFLRILFYLIMILGILSFMPWVSKKKSIFTFYGQKTAYIYLLHLVFIGLLYETSWFKGYDIWKFFISPVIAFCISTFVCSKTVIIITRPFIEGAVVYKLKNTFSILFKLVKVRIGGIKQWRLIKRF